MDKIKNELYSVDITFWEAYDGYLLNNISKTKILLDDNKKVKTDLNELFILLKFVIEKVNNILETDCSNSKCILNLLCIYSAILREFNNIMFKLSNRSPEKKSEFDKLSIEFIEIFNIFDNFLEIDLSRVITTTFDKIDKLYLKIIQLV